MTDSLDGLAMGVELMLLSTEDGGRQSPLVCAPGRRWAYRPNWGLPGTSPPDQTGAPVLALSRPVVEPGSTASAVIVTTFEVERWRAGVVPGVTLPMYEGARVRGHGTVLWRVEVVVPLVQADEERFLRWLADPSGAAPD